MPHGRVLALAALLGGAALFGLYARGSAAWPLGFIALVPWCLLLDRVTSWRRTLLVATLMAVAFVAAVFGWFAPAIAAYTGAPPIAAFALLLAIAPVLQPQLLAWALARHLAGRRFGPVLRATVAAAAWLATEWAVPRLFGDTLGHGLQPARLMRQAADVAGAPGLTLALIAVNEAIAVAVSRRREGLRRWATPLAVAAAVPLALAGYGALRLAALERAQAAPGIALRIGLVQAGITDYEGLRQRIGAYAVVRHVLDTHYALSEAAKRGQGIDALAWSETVYPTTFMRPKSADGAALDEEVLGFVRRVGLPLVLGTYDRDDAGEYNAAAFADPVRGALGSYRKTRLFPLTEYVPPAIDGPLLRSALPWAGTWRPGDGARVFPLRTADGREVPVLPLICLDDVDPQLALDGARLGAQAIIGLSNDSWFTATPQGARLHLRVAAFRSIETRLPQVRVTTNGLSAVVDPSGEVVAEAGMGERTVLVGAITTREPLRTPVVALGAWLGPFAAMLLAGFASVAVRARWRGRSPLPVANDSATASDSAVPALLLGPVQRIAIGTLRGFARVAVLVLGVAWLQGDASAVGMLRPLKQFAAVVLAPELAAAMLAWWARAQVRIADGELVIDTLRRRIAIPLRSVVAARSWRLPWPSPGLHLDLVAGGRWPQALALRDPEAFVTRLVAAGAPIQHSGDVIRRTWRDRAFALPPSRWDHPLWKFVLFPLVPALPAFRLHQHIAYGGTFGEAQTYGVGAWLAALALWWASWAMSLTLLAGGLRVLVEAISAAVLAAHPPRAPAVRGTLLGVARLVYYLGVPAWLAVRLLAG